MKKLVKNILRPVYQCAKNIARFIRRRKIKNRHFSIICNNCWGGLFYQRFGMKYESPTIGMVIPPKDFVRFCANLKYYLSIDVKPLDIEKAVNIELFKSLEISHQKKMILGKIDDVEICFLHYESFADASEKWNKRRERVHAPVIIKFNDNNGMVMDDLEAFNQATVNNKTIFTTYRKDFYDSSNAEMKFLLPFKLKDQDGVDDVYDYKKKFNVVKIINQILN